MAKSAISLMVVAICLVFAAPYSAQAGGYGKGYYKGGNGHYYGGYNRPYRPYGKGGYNNYYKYNYGYDSGVVLGAAALGFVVGSVITRPVYPQPYYAPPPVYYAPPPVYYGGPSAYPPVEPYWRNGRYCRQLPYIRNGAVVYTEEACQQPDGTWFVQR